MSVKDKLIMPNHIVVKDGLACGDKVTLLYDFVDESMQFQIISDGCNYCKKMCEYLQEKYNNIESKIIVTECERILEKVLQNKDVFEEQIKLKYKYSRIPCCEGPIMILKECAEEFTDKVGEHGHGVNLYVDKMDCDACAIRENVSWLYQKPSHIHGQYDILDGKREILMRLGRLVIEDMDKHVIEEIYESLNSDDFEFMEEYKLFPMVYQNLRKLGILRNDDTRWRLLVYQRQRTVMAHNEIYNISEFIKRKNYQAFWVKGAYTQQFYDEPLMRNLTDFDLLVTKEEDAFDIISYLLKKDFKIFPDSFSLKKTRQENKDVYTGHLHFQKIINLQYRLIVDVNFTGFPMIKVASYIPKVVNGHVCLESMIVVTLCHLFKHKEVFMKDINDLYLMLMHPELVADDLLKELYNNDLQDLFLVVAEFISKEYKIKEEAVAYKEIYAAIKEKKSYEYGNWPYDKMAVHNVKKVEFAKFAKDLVDTERIYLYPVLMFAEQLEATYMVSELTVKMLFENIETKWLTDKIAEVQINNFYFVFTPVGCFLEMKEYYNESMKAEIRSILTEILNILPVRCIDIPYAIAFEEKWLDD